MGTHALVFKKEFATGADYPSQQFLLDAVPDGVVASAGPTGFFVPRNKKIIGAMITGSASYTTGTERFGQPVQSATIVAPSLMTTYPPSIWPIANAPGVSDTPIQWLINNPLPLRHNDVLQVQATFVRPADGTTKGPSWVYAVIWLQDELEVLPPGGMFWFAGTAKVSGAQKFEWKTLSEEGGGVATGLAAGRYAIVGATVVGTKLLAARLQFAGQLDRPATIAVASPSWDAGASPAAPGWPIKPNHAFLDGSLGVLGYIETYTPPQFQVLFSEEVSVETSFVLSIAAIKVA